MFFFIVSGQEAGRLCDSHREVSTTGLVRAAGLSGFDGAEG